MRPDFDMNFKNYHTIDLVEAANNSYKLSYLDRGDLYNMVAELAARLEQTYAAAVGPTG
jgi:hypothetical protein